MKRLRCGGIFNGHFIADVMLSVIRVVKEFLTCVDKYLTKLGLLLFIEHSLFEYRLIAPCPYTSYEVATMLTGHPAFTHWWIFLQK